MSKITLSRLNNSSPYKRPLILAIALHVLLFAILFFHMAPSQIQQTPLQPDVNIIKAVAVSQDELTQLARVKAEQQRQAAQKAEALRKQQELAKQQAIAQKQKEAQEAAAKIAAQKQKEAQEAAAKLAAQQAQEKAQAEKEAAAAAEKAAAQKKAAEKPTPQKTVTEKPIPEKSGVEKATTSKPSPEKSETVKTKTPPATDKPTANKTDKSQASQSLKSAQQKDLQEKIAAEQRALTAARTQQQQSEIEKYKALIEQAISQNWEVPTGTNPDLSCELFIRVGPGGAVVNVQIARSSGDPALDDSARAAVFKASPLPVPEDTDLFNQFRELRLTVTPEDIK